MLFQPDEDVKARFAGRNVELPIVAPPPQHLQASVHTKIQTFDNRDEKRLPAVSPVQLPSSLSPRPGANLRRWMHPRKATGSSRGTAYFDPHPIFVDRGEGHFVCDVDGNRYLDFMINATSLILGHANPDIVRALQEQAARGTAFSGPTEAQVRLAKSLCDRIPSVDTIRFTNSGTEGTLKAVPLAACS